MLNNVGITFFNYLNVIDFNMPERYRDGLETLTYSYRLNTGFAPNNYKKDVIVKIIDGLTHMGIVINYEVRPIIQEWIESK